MPKTKPCANCGAQLKPLDQLGDDYLNPLCWKCYSEDIAQQNTDFWYGLGPHQHAYDDNGNIIIGTTTFDDLTHVPKDANGNYDFGDRTFSPDPETPGCGIWQMKPLKGWL